MPSYSEKFNTADFLKIVCVGDIQTAQPYSKPSWSDWLQRALWENGEVQTSWRRQVINTAISRATPKHVLSYFSHYVGQFKPDLTVLSFGVSPMYPEFVEKNFSADFDGLLDLFEKNNIPVVLWSPYPLFMGVNREITLTLGALYKQKAVARNLQFIDLYHEFDEVELSKIYTLAVEVTNELFQQSIGKPDGLSFNEIGQFILARKMASDLFKIGMPANNSGSFHVPNLEVLKRWR